MGVWIESVMYACETAGIILAVMLAWMPGGIRNSPLSGHGPSYSKKERGSREEEENSLRLLRSIEANSVVSSCSEFVDAVSLFAVQSMLTH